MTLGFRLGLGGAQPVGPASSITIDTAPAITGTAEVGETLTRTVGSYSGDGTITVSNGRWTRNGVDISPAQTGATYTLDPADDQTTVRWYEDVADAGSGDTITALSNGLYVTYAAPVEDAAPTASGDAVIGESLTGTSGTFTGSNLTESDEWEVSDDGTTGWTGTGDTDTTGPAQVSGKHYRFASTASNSGGTLTTYSSVIGPAIAPTISMAGLSGGEAVEGSHASITMSANIGTITARKWGSTSGGSQFGTGTNPTSFIGAATLYATATVGGIDYTVSAPIADTGLAITGNDSGTISITVHDDNTFSFTISGSSTTHHNGTFGPLDPDDLASGPILATAPVISGTAGTGETLTAEPGLWVFPDDDVPTIGAEWISDGTGTGDTDDTYLTDPGDEGGDVLYRETATNVAGARVSNSNTISIPSTDVWNITDNGDGTFDILSAPPAPAALIITDNGDGTFDMEAA